MMSGNWEGKRNWWEKNRGEEGNKTGKMRQVGEEEFTPSKAVGKNMEE